MNCFGYSGPFAVCIGFVVHTSSVYITLSRPPFVADNRPVVSYSRLTGTPVFRQIAIPVKSIQINCWTNEVPMINFRAASSLGVSSLCSRLSYMVKIRQYPMRESLSLTTTSTTQEAKLEDTTHALTLYLCFFSSCDLQMFPQLLILEGVQYFYLLLFYLPSTEHTLVLLSWWSEAIFRGRLPQVHCLGAMTSLWSRF